jgi:hypothetical protein
MHRRDFITASALAALAMADRPGFRGGEIGRVSEANADRVGAYACAEFAMAFAGASPW